MEPSITSDAYFRISVITSQLECCLPNLDGFCQIRQDRFAQSIQSFKSHLMVLENSLAFGLIDHVYLLMYLL